MDQWSDLPQLTSQRDEPWAVDYCERRYRSQRGMLMCPSLGWIENLLKETKARGNHQLIYRPTNAKMPNSQQEGKETTENSTLRVDT